MIDRQIVVALRRMLLEMDDSTPILKEWRNNIEVAIRVLREDQLFGSPMTPIMETVTGLLALYERYPTPERREALLGTLRIVLDYFAGLREDDAGAHERK